MPPTYASASDHDLSRAWQSGDRAAGAALFGRHAAALRCFLERRVGPDTEDIVQDVWTAVARSIGRYERRSAFRTWLFAVANNHARGAYRHSDRVAKIETLAQDLFDVPSIDPAEVCTRRQELERLATGLRELPDALRRVVSLYYFEQRPAAEIGRQLNIPENTVRSRVRRARALLEAVVQPAA